jgi:hypothetical protein
VFDLAWILLWLQACTEVKWPEQIETPRLIAESIEPFK